MLHRQEDNHRRLPSHNHHKKKAAHSGHHGGAWKVAYADFVTAMMALFIVLWLLNTSKPVRAAIAGYFRDPAGTEGKLGTSASGPGAQVAFAGDDMAKVKDEIEKAMEKMPNFDKLKEHIELKVTAEGLRIELLESAAGTFFDLGNPTPNEIWKGIAESSRRTIRQVAQQDFDRGAHRLETVQRQT